MENQPNQPTTGTDSPGLQATKSAVEFVNSQVLQAKVEIGGFSAKPVVDQATAMMIQDARAFLQGSEQITMAAMSKAISMTLSQDPTIRAAGTEALQSLEALMGKLSTFAKDIGTSASGIVKDFDSSSNKTSTS